MVRFEGVANGPAEPIEEAGDLVDLAGALVEISCVHVTEPGGDIQLRLDFLE